MARLSNFAQGAYAKGSNVVASRTVQIPTSVVTLPATRYGTTSGRKRRKGR